MGSCILDRYDPDSIRYFLSINAPENRDTDFSWREFIYSHNSELLGAYGNFINRTLKFIEKSYAGIIPEAKIDLELKSKIEALYESVGQKIEEGHLKLAIEEIFSFIRYANKYFDEKEPWKELKENRASCDQTIANCVLIITNVIQLLNPFLPFSTEKVKGILEMEKLNWHYVTCEVEKISDIKPLFERYDVKRIEEEVTKLIHESN